jgi:hypothetical protein
MHERLFGKRVGSGLRNSPEGNHASGPGCPYPMPTFLTRRPEGTNVSSSIPPRTGTSIKAIAFALVIAGLMLILLALFADTLGIGGGRGFGYQQMIVLIVGLVLMLGGVAIISPSWLNRMTRD